MQMQDYKRALYDFSAAIRVEFKKGANCDPDELSNYYMLAGQANQLLGQYEEALTHYEIAIKKKNSDGLIFYNRGITYSTLQRFEEAKRDFNTAIEKGNLQDPDKYKNFLNLGVTLRRLGGTYLEESITVL